MTPKTRIERSDPDWDRLAQKIRLGAFSREGMFVAFPLCFPGVTLPIPREESRVVTLTTDAEGMVYGATTGRANHVFFACFQATSGIVLDLKWPDPSAACPAICCGIKETLFAANPAAGGGLLLRRQIQDRPGDLLHEWSFQRHPFEAFKDARFNDPILDLVTLSGHRFAVCTTRSEVALYDFEERRIVDRQSVEGAGRICATGDTVFGFDARGALWHYRPATRSLARIPGKSAAVPDTPGERLWATDRSGRFTYLIDAGGHIYSLNTEGILTERSHMAITPVTAASVTHDGRLFAFAGEGIAHFHSFDPASGQLRDHGAAVSVLERRRYGYAFAAATTGQGGEIFFGENDDLGHLWLYFPTIQSPAV